MMKPLLPASESEIANRTARFLKAELKRAAVTYEELATMLQKHGINETKHGIAAKLNRGTFPATFFLAVLAAINRDVVRLDEI